MDGGRELRRLLFLRDGVLMEPLACPGHPKFSPTRSHGTGQALRRYGNVRANDGRRSDPFHGNGAVIERVCKQLASANGYGANFNTKTALPVSQWDSSTGPRLREDSYAIATRGRVKEQAARSIGGSSSTGRMRNWKYGAGIAVLPSVVPNPGAQLAFSEVGLYGPLRAVLVAFALEDILAWYEVERFAIGSYASPLETMAWRDAMARLMYFRAATTTDARAKQLRVQAATYREATANAQRVLTDWLVEAAHLYASVREFKPEPIGFSHGNGLRPGNWWRESERRLIRDGGIPSERPK